MGYRGMAVLWALSAVGWLGPSIGHAQGGGSGEVLRLGLSADLLSFEKRSVSLAGTSAPSETIAFGLTAPRLGVDIAGFVVPQFGLGVRGGLTGSNQTIDGMSTGALTYRVLGYAEGRFELLPVAAVMLRGEIGATGTHGSLLAFNAFAVGAQAGLHLHPVPAFSISPFVGFEYANGGGSAGGRSGGMEGFTISLGFSTFGWIELGQAPENDDIEAEAAESEVAPTERPESGGLTHTSSGWRVEVAMVGAEAIATVLEAGGVAQLELHVASVTARFSSCYEASFVAADRSARMQALGSATASPTGVEERVVFTGLREGLEILASEGSRIELCGATFEPTRAGREALDRLLARTTE